VTTPLPRPASRPAVATILVPLATFGTHLGVVAVTEPYKPFAE